MTVQPAPPPDTAPDSPAHPVPARLPDPADRVRWLIAIALSAILVLAVAVPVASIVLTRERSAGSVADEIVVRIGERTSDLVAGELTTATQSLELLARLVATSDDRSVDRVLAAEVQAVRQLSGAFVGYPDGGFRFVRRDGDEFVLKRITTEPDRRVTEAPIGDDLVAGAVTDLDDSYDPRVRPWYAGASASEAVVWTDPYVFFSSGEPGVTAATAIRAPDGSIEAVVGVDLALAEMAAFLDGLPIDETSAAFILTGDAVVAAPSRYDVAVADATGALALATPEQVGLDPTTLAAATGRTTPVTDGDGDRLYALDLDDPALPEWSVVVRTGEIEFVGVVERQSQIALVATIVAALALLAAIPLMVVRLRRPIDELSRQARFDPLTGLLNRAALLEAGQRELRRAYKSGAQVTLAVIDLDDFKSVNDRRGHSAGDEVLRSVGQALRSAVRPDDLVGRLGGDEFVVMMSGPGREDALEALERARDAIAASCEFTEAAGVTIGAAWLDRRALPVERLVFEADRALIDAKQHAKGTVSPG